MYMLLLCMHMHMCIAWKNRRPLDPCSHPASAVRIYLCTLSGQHESQAEWRPMPIGGVAKAVRVEKRAAEKELVVSCFGEWLRRRSKELADEFVDPLQASQRNCS